MTTPAVFKNETQPDWGLGLVVEDLPDSFVLVFEHAGRRKFVKAKAKVLVPVTVNADTLTHLQHRAKGRHAKAFGKPKPKAKAKPKAPKKARFASVDDQVALFEKLFEGGFKGDKFSAEERGPEGVEGKLGLKTAAIALAQAELSKERFESATPEELFESARKLLSSTTIVFPVEGAIPFSAMSAMARTATLGALKHLLHGEGDYGARLERFAAAMELKDKAGKSRAVSWPLATLFGAMFEPGRHACIKPTCFADQASTLGMTVEKSQPVSSLGYRQFLEVARKTQEALVERGHKPRDLMDVYTFIWRTHAEKPGATPSA
jgi:hypothetical protein